MKLRKHQKKQNKEVRKQEKKHKHILYGAPTGFGKSVCILEKVQRALSKGERILVIAPYRKLIWQLMGTFRKQEPALLMGSDSYGDTKTSPLIVASLPTLARRLEADKYVLGGLDRIITDEAHLGFNIPNDKPSKSVELLYKYYWDTCKWTGFTATPITAAGYRLQGWDYSVYMYDTKWLIDKGWLSKFQYYSIPEMSPAKLKINASTGDYTTSDMEKITNTTAAVVAVYNNYITYGKNKKTLIFAASITHSELINEYFLEQGVSSRVIHSMMPEREQMKILKEYENNVFEVLINVGMLTTGFDDPEVETLIIARPIGSKRLAIQVWGRVLRKHKDIKEVSIVDLCSVWEKCGTPDNAVDWNRVKGVSAEATNSIEDIELECSACSTVIRMIDCKRSVRQTASFIETTMFCPNCGNIASIKTVELEEEPEIEKIQTAMDIDYSKKYELKEIHQFLGEMIKINTRSAKTSWGIFIHRKCLSNNKKIYKEAIYGYAQKVYSNNRAWKMIMKVYDA